MCVCVRVCMLARKNENPWLEWLETWPNSCPRQSFDACLFWIWGVAGTRPGVTECNSLWKIHLSKYIMCYQMKMWYGISLYNGWPIVWRHPEPLCFSSWRGFAFHRVHILVNFVKMYNVYLTWHFVVISCWIDIVSDMKSKWILRGWNDYCFRIVITVTSPTKHCLLLDMVCACAWLHPFQKDTEPKFLKGHVT